VDRLAGWVSGRVVGVDPGAPVLVGPEVVIDSRTAHPGALFVALVGEHSDGHRHVAGAAAAGAAASLVRHEVPGGSVQVVVPDPVVALADLGRAVLADARAEQGGSGPRPPLRVVGVTGSSGKTSVKDLLGQLLAGVGPTVAPQGSFNNEIGVPLTAIRVEPDTRFLISEMGARGVGHIAYLCAITPPDVAVVLNVGQAHLGEFGSAEITAQAKGELVGALGRGPVSRHRFAVLNASDPRVAAMADRSDAAVIWFADARADADPGGDRAVWATEVTSDDHDRAEFVLHLRTPDGTSTDPVRLQLSGRHQVANALAAAGAALACGLTGDQIADGLSSARAVSHWRMEITERSDGTTVLNDAYNANPDSMAVALDSLAAIGARRRRPTAAVLGDMLELGAGSAQAHHELGRSVHEHGVGLLVTVGELAHGIADGAVAAGLPADRVLVVQDKTGLADRLAGVINPGTVVLVKASRGMGLETVARALLGSPGGTPAVEANTSADVTAAATRSVSSP